MADLARRTQLTRAQIEALATAGAFGCFDVDRRAALWAAGAVAGERPDRLPGTTVGADAPPLPGMDDIEMAVADVWATGLSPDSFPTQFVRKWLTSQGALPVTALPDVESGTRVLVGGAVTHRQRPATAGGVTFLNLEDETGMVNVVCTQGLWARYRKIARNSAALLVRGIDGERGGRDQPAGRPPRTPGPENPQPLAGLPLTPVGPGHPTSRSTDSVSSAPSARHTTHRPGATE